MLSKEFQVALTPLGEDRAGDGVGGNVIGIEEQIGA